MTTITLELPDELAVLVDQHRDRVPELLAWSLQTSPLPARLYRNIVEFFAGQPTPEQIASFTPSESMQERLHVLIERSHEGELTPTEAEELDEFERIEHLMIMIKSPPSSVSGPQSSVTYL